MKQQSQFGFRRRNVVFLGICLGGLAILLLVSIIPLTAQQYALDQEIVALKQELANQQQFQVGVGMVDGVLSKLDQQITPQVVSLTPLTQDDSFLAIQKEIKALASETSLELASIEPLLDNKNTWQSLTVHAELRGLFPDLRQFLLKLLSLPYVKQIDRVEIHPGSNGLYFSLTYTIVLA